MNSVLFDVIYLTCYNINQLIRRFNFNEGRGAMITLSNNLKGCSFKTDDGVKFTVVEQDYFSEKSIGRQHKKYLSALRPGFLVAVSFYGQPVPVVAVEGGVVKLVKVEIEDETLENALAISRRLGVARTRQPMRLYSI